MVAICMVLASFSVATIQSAQKAFAASSGIAVLEVTLKSSVMQKTFKVSYAPDSNFYDGYYTTDTLTDKSKYLGVGDYHEKISVSVKNLRPDIVENSSINYDKTIKAGYYRSLSGEISFTPKGLGGVASHSYYLEVQESPVISLEAATNTSSKGFHPSKNNSITLYSFIKGDLGRYNYIGHDTKSNFCMRILNSNGKTVFTKTYKNVPVFETVSYEWNGKASKGNAAKVKAGKYVKSGTYTFVATVTTTRDKQVIANLTSSTQFKVSTKAPKGVKGRAKAKALVLLTGDAQVDYMAEKMLKAAGVKSSMSADKKVKKIYSYMTKRFKHNHGDKKYTVYYNLKKLKNKIATYKKSADAKVAKGKAYYTHLFDGISWTMARRAGVCDHNAAAFVVLCNHAGVQADKINGFYKNTNGTLAGHAWNSAVVNGKTYYYDIDIEIQNKGKGQGNFYWYKKTLAQSKKNHKYL